MNLDFNFSFFSKKRIQPFTFFTLILLLPLSLAISEEEESEIEMEIGSYFFGDAAYFNEVQDFIGQNRSAEPYTRFVGGVSFATWPTENFMMLVNPEFFSSTQLPLQPGKTENPPQVSYVAYMEEGKAVYFDGDKENPSLKMTLGWQYYKDNPHGKIFGDYLIRSMIYPSLAFTSFQKARTQIFGFKLEKSHGDIFTHTAIIHTETKRYPFYDISLGYSGQAKFGDKFDIGVGLHWVSAIPVRPSRTTPRGGEYFNVADNTYKEVPFQDATVIVRGGDTIKTIWIKQLTADTGAIVVLDSTGWRDSVPVELLNGKMAGLIGGLKPSQGGYGNVELNKLTTEESKNFELYPELNGSQTKYSFSGQTLTFRFSFNPFAGVDTDFGKDAFKIYSELGVLGWKNYPGFYENRRERMPIMFGLNFPTFNFLDFLTVEIEHFPSKQPATWLNRFRRNVPQPGTGEIESFDAPWNDPDRQKKDDWKWGISTRKNFKGFGIWAQTGSDHMHSNTFDESFHEIMSRPSHWFLMVRLVLWTKM